jgi:hypothetical protein
MIPDLSDIKAVDFKLVEPGESSAPKFDYTALTAVSECPTWGIVRYVHGLSMTEPTRAVALEAGEALHDAFAAIRLIDLWRVSGENNDLFEHHTHRLFSSPIDRAQRMLSYFKSDEDIRTRSLNFMLEALNTSGFVDDPTDTKRTMSHLEESAIAYYDRWEMNRGEHSRIWRDDVFDRVGIEMPFSMLISFTTRDDEVLELQFTGRMDGLHVGQEGTIIVHENKTASRLDNAWLSGMRMSHQVTGYTIAASLMTQLPCDTAYIHGLSIPLPKSYDFGGVVREKIKRTDMAVKTWLNWTLHVYGLIVRYRDKPANAPRYTRACNRFFRPCPFIPLCDSENEAQFLAVLRDMVYNPWSPLDD